MKRKHKPCDKAKRMGELISLKQSAQEQPSDKDIAEMLKGLSFTIGRKEKHERRSNDTTADDKQLGTDD